MRRPRQFTLNRRSPTAEGLVGWWPCRFPGGGSVYDMSGYGHHGAWSGTGSHWVVDGERQGRVMTFNGVDDHVVTPGSNVPNGGSARAYMAWINVSGNGGAIVGTNTSSGQRYHIQVVNRSGTWYMFTDGVNAANNITLVGAQIPSAGSWHHIAFTKDMGDNWVYYLDGVNRKSGTFGTAINTGPISSVWLGDRADVATYDYTGLIDDARIYNQALSAAAITCIYHSGLRAPLSDLAMPIGRRVFAVSGGGPFPHYTRRRLQGGLIGMGI